MMLRTYLRRVFPERIRSLMRVALKFGQWLALEFFVSPQFALFSRRRSKQNEIFFATVKRDIAAGEDVHLVPHHGTELPKKIWIYWDKGEAEAPELVRRCIQSWREHNADWEVIVLDAATAPKAVDLSALEGTKAPKRAIANLLRLKLLSAHGGVWADATLLCHRPLETWLPLACPTGFFAFTDAGPDRLVESWFIVSEPRSRLVSGWAAAYQAEITKLRGVSQNYFVVMYCFEWALRHSQAMRAAWALCPRIPAPRCFLLASALQGRTPREVAIKAIRDGLPVSKLSWWSPVPISALDEVLQDAVGRTSSFG
jgi:hypothetical protein